MTIETLMQLRNSAEAPFDHEAYTIWLHNKIIDQITFRIWEIREKGNAMDTNGYVICNRILNDECMSKPTIQ